MTTTLTYHPLRPLCKTLCPLWLKSNNNWEENMTRHDLKADLMYLRSGDQYRAIGVITNRTWNYWTASGAPCGVAPKISSDDADKYNQPDDYPVYQTAVDVEYHSNKKIKVSGMKAKKYYIYYYDPANPTVPLDLEYTNDDHQTEWGPELDLEFPRLLSATRPFVLFKLVVKDNSLPPEFVPNQNGALAGQELSRDSLTEKDSIAGKSEISQQNSAKDNEIKLYPNPNNGNFALALPDNYELGNVQITDVTGKKVFEQKLIEKRTNLHLNLQNGVYYLRFANEKTVQTLQFIVL
jgi:hypothetical protein